MSSSPTRDGSFLKILFGKLLICFSQPMGNPISFGLPMGPGNPAQLASCRLQPKTNCAGFFVKPRIVFSESDILYSLSNNYWRGVSPTNTGFWSQAPVMVILHRVFCGDLGMTHLELQGVYLASRQCISDTRFYLIQRILATKLANFFIFFEKTPTLRVVALRLQVKMRTVLNPLWAAGFPTRATLPVGRQLFSRLLCCWPGLGSRRWVQLRRRP